jgi:glyoxylase-like metal-dependent hydrolase (beta-lactamase superfamily II)
VKECFVVGQHTTLVVDTGANALAAATIHGYATVARPGNRLVVIDTEKHFDHLGGNGYFRERGAESLRNELKRSIATGLSPTSRAASSGS